MKTYKVRYQETRWIVDYVYADSQEEAYDKFHDNNYSSLEYNYDDEQTEVEELEDE